MLAHQLGFPLPNEVAFGIWNWEKLWKQCGSHGGPGYDSCRPGSMSAMGMLRQQSLCDTANSTAFIDLPTHPAYHTLTP